MLAVRLHRHGIRRRRRRQVRVLDPPAAASPDGTPTDRAVHCCGVTTVEHPCPPAPFDELGGGQRNLRPGAVGSGRVSRTMAAHVPGKVTDNNGGK